MSHSKERKEKVCLNCGAALTDRYCPVCGQENIEPKETVWGLVSHFFNDITHFDGKFFSTVKYLITKPGFLSAEYIKGRRASYLHPIRMYVFTSAFFFIVFFSAFNPERLVGEKDKEEQLTELTDASSSLKEKLPEVKEKDTVLEAAMLRAIANIDAHAAGLKEAVQQQKKKDSATSVQTKAILDSAGIRSRNRSSHIQIKELNPDDPEIIQIEGSVDYHTVLEYDSVQKELPANKKEGWFTNAMQRKSILIRGKYKNDRKQGTALFLERFMHTLPQALFVSLPLFALLLLMLYARSDVYYADHGIFSIHLYCAIFLILLVYFGIDKLKAISGWHWLAIPELLMVAGIFFYLYKAMRSFYKQGRGKTILKFIILNICSFMIVMLLVTGFLFLSIERFS